jgi:MraZ protein
MFRGRSVHTIDAKGRISIPAGYRVEFERRSERAPMMTSEGHYLALYPFEDWDEIEKLLLELSPFDPNGASARRHMIGGAQECPIDKQGRILIQPALREFAGLTKDVVVTGVGTHLELWDKARFDQELARTQAQYGEISASVARLGNARSF